MATKKKPVTIYDDDGVLVEQTFSDNNVAVMKNEKSNLPFYMGMDVSVNDVIDTFAAYMLPRFNVNNPEEGPGECVLCGAKTLFKKRKICVDCLEKHGVENLLNKVQDVLDGGNTVYID